MQTEKKYATIVPNSDGLADAAYDEIARRLVPVILSHLENYTNENGFVPSLEGDSTEMPTKINRTVVIDGRKRWIHANTEQEYAEKLLKLYSGENTSAASHEFSEYAKKWFEIYAAPSVATVTANTYKRQLTKYLIPHFSGTSVEDITVDDVQRLFNDISGSKATKDKVKIVLSQILDAAVEDGLISKATPHRMKPCKVARNVISYCHG